MKPIIPKGWRRLRVGTLIKDGDKFETENQWWHSNGIGYKVGDVGFRDSDYIRRITPKEKP